MLRHRPSPIHGPSAHLPWAVLLLGLAGGCGGGDEPGAEARAEAGAVTQVGSGTARHSPFVDVRGLTDEDPLADLLILYTATVQGFIEPCGCVAGQIGGIDRMVSYIEDELAANPDAFFVDGGDLFCRHHDVDANQVEQLPFKAEAFFEVWSSIDCTAIALGETDLALGVERLAELSERYQVPILCANVLDDRDQPVFTDKLIIERGGKRIGLFGLLAPELTEAEVKDQEPRSVNVAKLLNREGLKLSSWRKAARDVVQELRKECDVIVCVSHLGFRLNKVLAESEPDVDVIVGGHWDDATEATAFVGKTPVLVSFAKGSRVGRIEMWWGDEASYFKPEGHGRFKDVSARRASRTGAVVESLSLVDIEGREGSFDGDLYEITAHNHRAEREIYLQAVADLGPLPEGNLLSHYLVPMSAQFRRSELALDAVDRYHELSHEHFTRGRGAQRMISDSQTFAGAARCEACHPQQYEFWLATRHSRAITALAATKQDTDPECIGCHTVGYQQSGGFNDPGRYGEFANVQCAACHGPGAAHVLGGASYLDRTLIVGNGMLGCATCHNHEHDPKFDERSILKLAAVACPPMEEPGEGNANLRAAFLQGAHLLETKLEQVPWEIVSESYLGAGELAASLRAAEAWFAEAPKSRAAATLLADRYLDAGRNSEAAELYRKLVKRFPEATVAWIGLGRAVLDEDPQLAVQAGMEAFSLAPSRVDTMRLVARALIATENWAQAEDAIAAFLEARPDDRERFQDLLDQIEAER